MAYRGGGWLDGREAQWVAPPAGQRGPEAEAGLAAEALAWLQRTLGADSGAGRYDLYLHHKVTNILFKSPPMKEKLLTCCNYKSSHLLVVNPNFAPMWFQCWFWISAEFVTILSVS